MLVAGLTLATSVGSQPIIDYDAMPDPMQTVEIDLDGDSAPEIASAYTLNDRFSIVTIRPPERGGDRDFDAAFIVPINLFDEDTLEALQPCRARTLPWYDLRQQSVPGSHQR